MTASTSLPSTPKPRLARDDLPARSFWKRRHWGPTTPPCASSLASRGLYQPSGKPSRFASTSKSSRAGATRALDLRLGLLAGDPRSQQDQQADRQGQGPEGAHRDPSFALARGASFWARPVIGTNRVGRSSRSISLPSRLTIRWTV